MIEQPIAGAVAGLVYAILGYWKNKRLEDAKFSVHKSVFTIAMSIFVGGLMAWQGITTGSPATDGLTAVGLGSIIKKAAQSLFGRKK